MSAHALDPRDVYWIVIRCPCCGRRTRASSLLAGWQRVPEVGAFADAEMMITKSGGPGKLTNLRSPLWTALGAVTDTRSRLVLGDRVGEFFRRMEARIVDAGRGARDAVHRARWG